MTACRDERVESRTDRRTGTPPAVRLRELTATAPDAPAVTDYHSTVIRRELDVRTNRLARWFAVLGVRAGDHVSIALPNGIRHIECSVAAWKLGAVPQPLSHRLPPAGSSSPPPPLSQRALHVLADGAVAGPSRRPHGTVRRGPRAGPRRPAPGDVARRRAHDDGPDAAAARRGPGDGGAALVADGPARRRAVPTARQAWVPGLGRPPRR
jgi:hypothetical protein